MRHNAPYGTPHSDPYVELDIEPSFKDQRVVDCILQILFRPHGRQRLDPQPQRPRATGNLAYLHGERATLGRYQDRIRRLSESRLECTFLQIVVQSPFFIGCV
jgi:hypothetical protein